MPINENGSEFIAYCFHSVDGMSDIGSYVGTGAAGNNIVTGFRPAFVMVKSSSNAEPWFILDNKRDPNNPRDNRLMADSNAAESDGSVHTMDFNSNGFTLNGTLGNGTNGIGVSYIFLAIAEEVFVPDNFFNDDSTVATYKLNGDAGDDSGNGNNGVATNVTYVAGKFGQAASFASNGNFNTGYSLSGSYTISLWCKNTASGYDVFNTTNSSGDNGIIFRGLRSGAVGFIDKWGAGNNYAVHTYTYPQDTNWHNFVLSFTNNNNCKIYFDGALILDFNSAQSTFINSTSLNFGEGLVTGNDPTGINLDQVRIFDRALDSGEAAQLANE